MGLSCSKQQAATANTDPDIPDPEIYEFIRDSVATTQWDYKKGQSHLLYKQQQQQLTKSNKKNTPKQLAHSQRTTQGPPYYPTKLLIRRHAVRTTEEGMSGTHIYAVRWADEDKERPLDKARQHQQLESAPAIVAPVEIPSSIDTLFQPDTMAMPPKRKVSDWVTVSKEHNIHVADVGLTVAECDAIVAVTEQVCRGQYAAYTYAKQTLGCREFPTLAVAVQDAVHTVTAAILDYASDDETQLALDDREPHMVKYDVTKRERQKLDMHTDKSEWTFLISLSNGCCQDFSGGGTYFECLDSTVHVQRGHALVFPGRLRHCGQRISSGLRFLLVGFLVDKSNHKKNAADDTLQAQYASNIP